MNGSLLHLPGESALLCFVTLPQVIYLWMLYFFLLFRYSLLFFRYCDFPKRSLCRVCSVQKSHQGAKRLLLNQGMILRAAYGQPVYLRVDSREFERKSPPNPGASCTQGKPWVPVSAAEFRILDTAKAVHQMRGEHEMTNQNALLLYSTANLLKWGLVSPESVRDGISASKTSR